jgi:cytochrome P450
MGGDYYLMRAFPAVDIEAWFDEIRESGPIARHQETGTWYITRFDDVWKALVDPRLGARESGPFFSAMSEQQQRKCERLRDFVNLWPLFLNPPQHTVVRRMLFPIFSRAYIERAVLAAQRSAAMLRSEFRTDDILATFIRPMCEAALSSMLDVDPCRIRDLSDWSSSIMPYVGMTSFDSDVVSAADRALDALSDFVRRECQDGRGRLAGILRDAVSSGDVDFPSAVAIYAQLLTGTMEPTISATAVALEAMIGTESALASFAAGHEAAISEAVRLATPFHFAPRCASEDLLIRGVQIAKGERVTLALLAANRDPRRFSDPTAFQPDRGNNWNVTYGRGRHACLGASLANEMVRVIIDQILTCDVHAGASRVKVQWRWELGMHMPVLCNIAS